MVKKLYLLLLFHREQQQAWRKGLGKMNGKWTSTSSVPFNADERATIIDIHNVNI